MRYFLFVLLFVFTNNSFTDEKFEKYFDDSHHVYVYRYVEVVVLKSKKPPFVKLGGTFDTLDECISNMKEDVEFYIEEKKKAEIKLDEENNMYMEATGTKGKLYTNCYKERVPCIMCMK